MSKVQLSSRRRIAEAIRMLLRVETEDQDRTAADDLVELLKQWESGVIHGHAPSVPTHDNGHTPDTNYG